MFPCSDYTREGVYYSLRHIHKSGSTPTMRCLKRYITGVEGFLKHGEHWELEYSTVYTSNLLTWRPLNFNTRGVYLKQITGHPDTPQHLYYD